MPIGAPRVGNNLTLSLGNNLALGLGNNLTLTASGVGNYLTLHSQPGYPPSTETWEVPEQRPGSSQRARMTLKPLGSPRRSRDRLSLWTSLSGRP